jgi:geranylgeranyl pyrophosphate synthase
LEIIQQYLEKARQTLRGLPDSNGRAGLLGLTEYLARQAVVLGVCA